MANELVRQLQFVKVELFVIHPTSKQNTAAPSANARVSVDVTEATMLVNVQVVTVEFRE